MNTKPETKKPRLEDWSVKRSGPSQTIDGVAEGQAVKITGVSRVKRVQSGLVRRTVALDARGIVLAFLAD